MDKPKTLWEKRYITHVMKTKKVRIFQENEDLENDLINFLSDENLCPNFKNYIREYKINEILSNKKELKEWKGIMMKFGLFKSGYQFQLQNSLGSIYESKISNVISLLKITHTTKSIYFDGNNLFGIIDIINTASGKHLMDLDEDTLILIPIYTSENKLYRFDLELKRNTLINKLKKSA